MNLKVKIAKISALIFLLIGIQYTVKAQEDLSFNDLSESFLHKLKNGEDTSEIRKKLADTTIEELEIGLATNQDKLAFWVNIYNAYILHILGENPEKYNDRRSFFKEEQIPIAGELRSFSKIEHGLIRKSQWEYGLGLIRKWFPNKFERKLRVDKRDYRIHFALNCGAKECPPVAVYTPEKVNEQFDKGTERYLKRTTTFDADKNLAKVTSLFNWFRGDFGCKSGVRDILRTYKVVPPTEEKLEIEYKNYDWTLDLNNFIEL